MGTVKLKKNGHVVEIDRQRKGTINVLKNGGYKEVASPKVSKPTKQADISPLLEMLAKAGFENEEAVIAASDEDLLAVNGFGPKSLEAVREALG